MKASSPAQVIELFSEALNSGDVDGAMGLYEPEATFAPQPGQEVKGRDAIRAALDDFAALKPRLQGEISSVLTAGDVALVMNRWQLEGRSPTAHRSRCAATAPTCFGAHPTAVGAS